MGRTSTERLLKSQSPTRLRKLRTRTKICTYNACTLASEASVEDLMMQAKKIKSDVIGLTETRRHYSLHAAYDSGEELFLGTCDSRGVGGVGALVNTQYESLTNRIGRLRLKRCGSVPALTVFVAYAPTSDYDDEEVEAFYVELEKFYKEDHTFYKVIVGDFNAKIGPRRSPEELNIGNNGLDCNEQGERLSEFIMSTKTIHGNSHLPEASLPTMDLGIPRGSDHRLLRARFRLTTNNWDLYTSLAGLWDDAVMGNVDEKYDRFVHHLHDSAKGAERLKTTKRRLSLETL
ncbi:unnamed protein product [Heligmosomoides polygyrus]|uniref:Endo/exonuclease/phosphatase domain-containing protein n=1 Tax=Heligmosomoides polygyrus TaxID=6339 RepID=A0A183FDH6_HELPZ|nr:unnamed protein product [Heligmosomoides polygyrus]